MASMAKQTMATISILIATGSLFLLAQAKETIASFDFPIFNTSSLNEIVLEQDANVHDDRIYLTKSRAVDDFNETLGWAVYKSPIRLWNKQFPHIHGFKSLYQWRKKLPLLHGSFQSHFQFTIDAGATTQKNGLAFFMAQLGSEPPPANSSSAMWLGLFNTSTNGAAPSKAVAIEFDSNHVGVNNISSVANYSLPKNQSLKNGNITWNAWIEYNATGMALSVFLANVSSRPIEPILHVEDINFSQILPRDVVVGFSATTTGVNMSIISWKFSSQTPVSRKTLVTVIVFTMMLTTSTSAIVSAFACICQLLLMCVWRN